MSVLSKSILITALIATTALTALASGGGGGTDVGNGTLEPKPIDLDVDRCQLQVNINGILFCIYEDKTKNNYP